MSPDKQIIQAQLKSIIFESFSITSEDILQENTNFSEELNFSSLDFIILFVKVEEFFQIIIDESALASDHFKTIKSMVAYIEEKLLSTDKDKNHDIT